MSDRARRGRRNLAILALQVGILVVILIVWQVGSFIKLDEDHYLIDPFYFSRPTKIWLRAVEWVQEGTIWKHLIVTAEEAVGAFVLGVVLGVVVGFALARWDFMARVFTPYIVVINALPRLVFAPIFILLLGLDQRSKIAIGFSLVFFIVFFNAFQGVREVDRSVFNNARMLGAGEWQMTRHVLLPSAMGWVLASIHTSVGFAMAGVVVGEYIGSSKGLGYLIANAEGNLDATGTWAGLFVISIFVIIVELGVTQAERRLVRWRPSAAGTGVAGEAA
jgi:NitT/TauT family transport system permease protein